MTNEIRKIDIAKFKLIDENLKFKKNVNALIDNEAKELPKEKKDIIVSILNNLKVKNDVRIKKLLDKFKRKQKDLNLEKSKKIVDDFKKIDNEIVKFDEDEIIPLSNTKIQNKFADLKANLADTNITLLEKDLKKEISDKEDINEQDQEEIKQLQFDFETLKNKIETINHILDFSYKETDQLLEKINLKKKYNYKITQIDYFSKYYKYKLKYNNLKKILNNKLN